jgi:signal transduction histidine kinase/ligand-binding sensor domain-containing protein
MSRSAAEKTHFFRVGLLLAALNFFLPSARAAGPNYFTRTWQVEQGLPQNKVTAVVQTRDGYLWLGTYKGLARFDGAHFTVFDDSTTPGMRSSRITSLLEAADGSLWMGTESGDVLRYRDGSFAAVPLHANWSGGKIHALATDEAGNIWVLNESGELARVTDGKVLSPPSGVVTNVVNLARSRDGTIWIGRAGIISALKNGRLEAELATNDYVQGYCAARDGGFWVACNSEIRKWKDGKWVANLGAAPWAWNIVPSLAETSSGLLAGGTAGDGLWLVSTLETNVPPVHLNLMNGLPSDWVISLCEDREGNLWCGTGAGLVVIRRNNVEVLAPPDNWKSRPVLSVWPRPDGTLWVGTEGAGLYRLSAGNWKRFDDAEGLHNSYVWSLATDPAGRIWAGTWGGGVFYQPDDSFQFPPGLETMLTPIPAMYFLGDELWLGTATGAGLYRHGELQRFNEIDGRPFGDVRGILADRSGTLWFGTAGAGLVRREHGAFQRFRRSDGLSSDFIECLYVAEDGALWLGTFGGGLDRFKNGKFSVINRDQGLPNSVIGHIESDGRGNLWMSSFGGILRANEAELNRCADGGTDAVAFVTYGLNDGLPTVECSEGLQAAGARAADGRLLFATAKGLVCVDPSSVTFNSQPPPVRIEEMRVDGRTVTAENAGDRLSVPPGRHRLEFKFTGLSFVAPEKVRFKWRLKNFDADWAPVSEQRTAVYDYLPPGRYSFEVTACNNDGVWSPGGAQLAFEVQPYFWQTVWFRFLGGAAALLAASAAVWFETRRRLRRELERAERQRDIERERTRIARDIHDDLGAQLTRITMLSESAREEAANPARIAAGLATIYDTARELTRSMDEIVWAVNPRHDTLEGLATYLERFAHDWLAGLGLRCRLDFPVKFPEWHLSSEVRHNLFLAFKEALHNVVKHSGASEVFIRMSLTGQAFELAIIDNGRGFQVDEQTAAASAPGSRPGGGNGLENMARRLTAVGGACRIQSRPESGTTVVFTVPAGA